MDKDYNFTEWSKPWTLQEKLDSLDENGRVVCNKANDKQIGGNTCTITLSKGEYALVDLQDYELLSSVKWSCVVPNGTHKYAVRMDGSKYVYMHRVIMDAEVGTLVDHINGNTLDNRRENLRFATKSQNSINSSKIRGISRYKGVWFRERNKPWVAEIHKDGVKYHLGSFKTEVAAAIAYNKKAVELFGDFAVENKIEW